MSSAEVWVSPCLAGSRSLFDETLLNVIALMLCQISDGLSSRAFISHLKRSGNACFEFDNWLSLK